MWKTARFRCIAVCCAVFMLSDLSFAVRPLNFTQAKDMAGRLFSSNRVTLYCHCRFNLDKEVNLDSCNMQTAKPLQRANRIEWEHMMPAEHFGRKFACWNQSICVNSQNGKSFKGRKCCEKIDEEYRKTEGELFNLWPAVGAVNQLRSNYEFGIVDNKRGYYGCEFDVDPDTKIAEPPDRAKGIVARANLFMADKYHVTLSASERKLFLQWNKQFPPDKWELAWANNVASQVGYENPYITAWERHLTQQ